MGRGQAGLASDPNFLPRHSARSKGTVMTVNKMITIVDRIALALINTLVVIGLPLIAAGVLTQTL
jgi:hypothetical protein